MDLNSRSPQRTRSSRTSLGRTNRTEFGVGSQNRFALRPKRQRCSGGYGLRIPTFMTSYCLPIWSHPYP